MCCPVGPCELVYCVWLLQSATPRVLSREQLWTWTCALCICETRVTVDLAIGSGHFQVPGYTLLPVPEDTRRERGGSSGVSGLLCL